MAESPAVSVDYLSLPQAEVYKDDPRSRVWRVRTPGGDNVVKCFTYNTLRQAPAWLIGLHPVQRERRRSRQMQRDDLRTVPIETIGCQWSIRGAQGWLVTPWVGVSLFNLFFQKHLEGHPDRRRQLIEQAGVLTAQLVAKRWFQRDHKASNLVVDANDRLWMIDVGSVRRLTSERQAQRMWTCLKHNLAEAGASEAELRILDF